MYRECLQTMGGGVLTPRSRQSPDPTLDWFPARIAVASPPNTRTVEFHGPRQGVCQGSMEHMDKAIFDQGLVTRVCAGVPKTDFFGPKTERLFGGRGGSGRHPRKGSVLHPQNYCPTTTAGKGVGSKNPLFLFFGGGVQKGLLIYPPVWLP